MTRHISAEHTGGTTVTAEPESAPAPLLLKIEDAAKRLGIGRTLMYSLIMSGEIESVPVGRLRRVPAECLDEYVQRLRAVARDNPDLDE